MHECLLIIALLKFSYCIYDHVAAISRHNTSNYNVYIEKGILHFRCPALLLTVFTLSYMLLLIGLFRSIPGLVYNSAHYNFIRECKYVFGC